MSPRFTRQQSLMDFERFCQAQLYDVTRELREVETRMLRTKRLGRVLSVEEMQCGMAMVEVRR